MFRVTIYHNLSHRNIQNLQKYCNKEIINFGNNQNIVVQYGCFLSTLEINKKNIFMSIGV